MANLSKAGHAKVEHCLAAAFFIVLLTLAVYEKALWFVPDADDLRILSSVSQTSNPLSYFTSDWGMAGTYRAANGAIDTARHSYRAMHSVSIWLMYRMHGVAAFPNQLINFCLHLINGLLLYRVLRRVCADEYPAFLLAVLGVISVYTESPTVWVSNRPMLVVALCTLLLLRHVVDCTGECATTLNPWIVTGLTVLALSFEESGLVLPLIAGAYVLMPGYKGARWWHLAWFAGLLLAYLGWRVILFGPNASAYISEGFVFGTRPYNSFAELSHGAALWARCENVLKDTFAVFIPIVDPMGRVISKRELVLSVAWWLPTLALTGAVLRSRLTKVQWFALAIIVLNAGLHLQVFRYRVLYVAQLAFCLFVAASRLWIEDEEERDKWLTKRRFAEVCCALIAIKSVSMVNHDVQANWNLRHDELVIHRLADITRKYPIAPAIVEETLTRYSH
jgi:hypothetical protein